MIDTAGGDGSYASRPQGPPAEAFLPARRTPLVYFGFGHACLLVAFGLLSLRASELAGFYYHPRLIAVVHLVTLGFVTGSILGALYLVSPLALRTPLPERRLDTIVGAVWAIAVSGITSHFWLERYAGMAWAGATALCAASYVVLRAVNGLRSAPLPGAVKLTIALAITNLLLAGTLGVLLGVNKHAAFLPFGQLRGVHAHLHLAVLGFATMMVVGVGYRILPMLLPAAMPRGSSPLAASVALECGVLGLVWALLDGSPWLPAFAWLTAAGLALFLFQVAFMFQNRRPAPSARPRPDWSTWHLRHALGCLIVACGLGLYLASAEASEASLRASLAYGALGLVGFLSQLVVAVLARVLPLASWLVAFASGGYRELPPSQHAAMPHGLLGFVCLAWTLGVPALALGLAYEQAATVAVAAGSLAAAVLAFGAAGVVALRKLRVREADRRES